MSSTDNNILAYYYGFNEKPMEIRKKCETGYYLKKTKQNLFDIGAFGSISEVCLKSDCKYIVKLIPISYEKVYKTFLREALIAPMMAKYGIGPKIHDIFICLNAGYIIMDKWDGSIRKLTGKNELTEDHLITISDLIVKMHTKGVIHNDLHTANVLYRKKSDGSYEFCLTDFGLSLYFENKDDIIPTKFIPSTKSPNIFFPAFDFYKFSNALESRRNIIFIPFFFNKGYISLIDNLLVSKFYTKSEFNATTFNDFLESVNLDRSKIKKTSKIDSSAHLLDSFKFNKKSLFNKSFKNNRPRIKTNSVNSINGVNNNNKKSLSKKSLSKKSLNKKNTGNSKNIINRLSKSNLNTSQPTRVPEDDLSNVEKSKEDINSAVTTEKLE